MNFGGDGAHVYGRVEVLCKESSLTWDKLAYNIDILSGILAPKKFEEILSEASKIIGHAITKKKKNDDIKLPNFVFYLSMLAVILAICYMVTLYAAAYNTSRAAALAYTSVAVICIAGSAAITLILSIFNFFRKIREFKSLETFMKEDLDDYMEHLNLGYINKCAFAFIPGKDKKIIEISTLVKSDRMILDDNPSEKKKGNANLGDEGVDEDYDEGERPIGQREIELTNLDVSKYSDRTSTPIVQSKKTAGKFIKRKKK